MVERKLKLLDPVSGYEKQRGAHASLVEVLILQKCLIPSKADTGQSLKLGGPLF